MVFCVSWSSYCTVCVRALDPFPRCWPEVPFFQNTRSQIGLAFSSSRLLFPVVHLSTACALSVSRVVFVFQE